jgi:hypothetical protein
VQDPAHKEEVMRPFAGRVPLPADPERKKKSHCGPRGGHVKEGVFPRSVSGTLSGRDLGQIFFNGSAFGHFVQQGTAEQNTLRNSVER